MKKNLTYVLGLAAVLSFFPGNANPKSEQIPDNFSSNYSLMFQAPLKREDVIISHSDFMLMYMDCDQKIYNSKTFKYAKTRGALTDGVVRRRSLEELWTRYFDEQVINGYFQMHHMDTTQKWYSPLEEKNSFYNGFNDSRIRAGRWKEKHKAIDIFAKTGSYIHAPVSSVVLASADDWKGSWNRREGFNYESGGLGKLSGNGVILFNPVDTSYYFMIHMKDVYTHVGDVVSRGEIIGTVGVTGNAIYPSVTKHLHFAHKKPGKECGIEGVLVAQNPYRNLKATTN